MAKLKARCNKCHRPMKIAAFGVVGNGACECGGLIENGEPITHVTWVIKRFGLEQQDRKLHVPCDQFYHGFTLKNIWEYGSMPGWRFQPDWSDGYREVFILPEERAIFTYCEGDLDLTVDVTDEVFQQRLVSAGEFYGHVAII